jgi:hypothetical protein
MIKFPVGLASTEAWIVGLQMTVFSPYPIWPFLCHKSFKKLTGYKILNSIFVAKNLFSSNNHGNIRIGMGLKGHLIYPLLEP